MKTRILLLIIIMMFLTSCDISEKFYESKFIQVASNSYITYYLSEKNDLFVQGGDSEFIYTNFKKDKDGIFLKNIKSINIANEYGSAISKNNELYFWSHKRTGSFDFLKSFNLMDSVKKPQIIAKDVLMSKNNEKDIMLIIDKRNRLLLIGKYYDNKEYNFKNPLIIDSDVKDMFIGNDFLIYVKNDGSLYGIGSNINKTIDASGTDFYIKPHRIDVEEKIISIKGYFESILVKDVNNNVFAWGKKLENPEVLKNFITPDKEIHEYISVDNKNLLSKNVYDYDVSIRSYGIVDNDGYFKFWGVLGSSPKSAENTYDGTIVTNKIKSVFLNQGSLILIDQDGKTKAWGNIRNFSGLGNSNKNQIDYISFDKEPVIWGE